MVRRTVKAGLIGENIGRSQFSAAQEKLCNDANIEWEFTHFDTTEMPDFDFNRHIDHLIATGFTGVTVTHPYKTLADSRADIRMRYPSNLGAANTLIFGDNITAHNTDYLGMIDAWRCMFGLNRPNRVAIAGAGGVARAIICALRDIGVTHIDIWDAQAGRAENLIAQLDPAGQYIHLATPDAIQLADGLVNATPVGMREYPGSAFPADLLGSQKWVFDAVYTPIETQFMQDAKSAGLLRLSGLALFKHMAVNSFVAYTGSDYPEMETINEFAKNL